MTSSADEVGDLLSRMKRVIGKERPEVVIGACLALIELSVMLAACSPAGAKCARGDA